MITETPERIRARKPVSVLDRSSFPGTGLSQQIPGSALLVDKPCSWTSYDVIRRLKRYFPKSTKIGHAGTLDPLATGLLILLFGKATKSHHMFLALPKTYEGTVRLGEVTPSMDSETEVLERKSTETLTLEQVKSACAAHTGAIQQIPPMYSAVKVNGERLYKKARRGESVPRRPNTVTIHALEVLDIHGADVRFRVRCSKGTYIRVLAHDVGQHLHVGGHLTRLRRTAIGEYNVQQSFTVEELTAILENT